MERNRWGNDRLNSQLVQFLSDTLIRSLDSRIERKTKPRQVKMLTRLW